MNTPRLLAALLCLVLAGPAFAQIGGGGISGPSPGNGGVSRSLGDATMPTARDNLLSPSTVDPTVTIGGRGALFSVGTNTYNTAIGYNAAHMYTGTGGGAHAVTAFGAGACATATTGADISCFGADAGNNTAGTSFMTGSNLLLGGVHAGGHIGDGAGFIAVWGNHALQGCGDWTDPNPACVLTGSYITAMGSYALQNARGTANELVAFGYSAGNEATTASQSIFVGPYSGTGCTTGTQIIMIGRAVSCPTATSSNVLNIGNLIRGTGVTQGGAATDGAIMIYGSAIIHGTGNTIVGSLTPDLLVNTRVNTYEGPMFARWLNDSTPEQMGCLKSRNTTPGSFTIVQTGDTICSLAPIADDGATYLSVGALSWGVVGTPAAGDVRTQATIQTRGASGLVTMLNMNGNAGTISTNGNKIADTSGNLYGASLVINNATNTVIGSLTPDLMIDTISAAKSGPMFARWLADATAESIGCLKSRNTTPGSFTIVQTGDTICSLAPIADDGATYLSVGALSWGVVGTPAAGDVRTQASIQVRGASGLVAALTMNGNSGLITTNGHTIADTSGNLYAVNLTLTQASPVAAAACTAGQFAVDTGFLYTCASTGVWKRVAVTGGY